MFQFTIFSSILFVTTLVNLAVTRLSWQRRKSTGGIYFALGMLAVSLWTFASGLDYAAVTIPLKVFFAQVETLGYNAALALFTAFALVYAGYENWLNRFWVKGLLVLIPVSNSLLAWTNSLHTLYWREFQWSETGNNVLIFEHGAAFPWVVLSSYLQVIVMFASLGLANARGSELSRRQARLLFSALLIPVFGNLIYHLGLPGLEGIDWSSITFSMTGAIFMVALYQTKLLNLVPVARHTLVEQLQDAILVLDASNQLIDYNLAATNLLGIGQKQVGSLVQDVLPDWALGLRSILLVSGRESQNVFFHHEEKRYFDVKVSQLTGRNEQVYGWLIIFRDVSQRFLAEQDMAYQLAEIKLLNESLRQAQAELVEQQRALARLEERQRMGRDMHDSVNQSIHGMMLFSDTLAALLKKGQSEQALGVMERMQASGRQALQEIRLLLFETHSRFSKESLATLVEAVEERLDMVERRAGIYAAIFDKENLTTSLSEDKKENLYWLIIEALNNVLKHSGATRVEIILASKGKDLSLTISDNGEGFNPSQASRGGLGMKTMRERANLLGGQLEVESVQGHGTRIGLAFPMESGDAKN